MSIQNFRVDSLVAGLAVKAPCNVATDGPITLSGLQTVNGLALQENDRVLVKDQANTIENGIYLVQNAGWRRTGDFDGNRDVVGGTIVPAYNIAEAVIQWFSVDGQPNRFNPGIDAITFSIFFDPQVSQAENLQNVTTAGDTTTVGIDIRNGAPLRIRNFADVADVQVLIDNLYLAPEVALSFQANGLEAYAFDEDVNVDGDVFIGPNGGRIAFYRKGDAIASYIRDSSEGNDIEYVAVSADHVFTADNVSLTPGTTLLMNAGEIRQANLQDYSVNFATLTISANSVTVDHEQAQANSIDVQNATADFNVVLSNPPSNGQYGEVLIEFIQGSTAYNALWPASVTWPGGTPPVLSTADNAVDVVHLWTRDGGVTWRGSYTQDYQ